MISVYLWNFEVSHKKFYYCNKKLIIFDQKQFHSLSLFRYLLIVNLYVNIILITN